MLNKGIGPLLGIAIAALLAACGPSEQAAPARVPDAAAIEVPASSPPPPPEPAAAATRPLLEQVLAYGEGRNNNLEGFLAMPADAAEPLPGIIVIHERWGLNESIKTLTRRLAGEGYVVLAVDLYGGSVADTPERAQALMTESLADPDAARNNLRQAYDYLEKYAFAPRIGALGWSMGGGWSLQTALLYPDTLDAAVTYYGQLVASRDELATLNTPILGFFGGEDASIPVRQVQDFRELLTQLGKTSEVLIVPGVTHGFASPGDANYDDRAATEAWGQMLAFLQRYLKVAAPPQ